MSCALKTWETLELCTKKYIGALYVPLLLDGKVVLLSEEDHATLGDLGVQFRCQSLNDAK